MVNDNRGYNRDLDNRSSLTKTFRIVESLKYTPSLSFSALSCFFTLEWLLRWDRFSKQIEMQ